MVVTRPRSDAICVSGPTRALGDRGAPTGGPGLRGDGYGVRPRRVGSSRRPLAITRRISPRPCPCRTCGGPRSSSRPSQLRAPSHVSRARCRARDGAQTWKSSAKRTSLKSPCPVRPRVVGHGDGLLSGPAVLRSRLAFQRCRHRVGARLTSGHASESIQRSMRRASRVISSGSRNVFVSSAIPW